MTPYLFLGDTHNDLDFAESAAKLARQHGAELVQLGDWGFTWPGSVQLTELSDMLVGLGVMMRFIDGNHDDHPGLKKLRGRVRARGVTIAKNVVYQPRGSVHEDEDGTRFLFLGGAPSIDQARRVKGESWWPEEVISQADLDLARSAKGPIHVLVTHDAPAFPPGFTPKGSPSYQRDQLLSMKRVDALIRRHRPSLHIHGHWHARYTRQHKSGTIIEGLNCNEIDPTYLDEATLLWSRGASRTAQEKAMSSNATAIYHVVYAHETFEHAAQTLFLLVGKAQEAEPGLPRKLYLDIEGHRNEVGGFDADMLELQQEFIIGFLMPFLSEAVCPFGHLQNPKPQRNDMPEALKIAPAQKATS